MKKTARPGRLAYAIATLAVGTILPTQVALAQDAPAAETPAPETPAPAAKTLPTTPVTPSPPEPPITPPQVLHTVAPTTPASDGGFGEVSVELFVVVEEDGRIGAVSVARSAGDAFDAAAMKAVRQWQFAPAQRGNVPLSSRIRVNVDFKAPEAEPDAAESDGAAAVAVTSPSSPPELPAKAAPASEEPAREVIIEGERTSRNEGRTASDFHIGRSVLAAAPRQEGAEVLRSAPGMYIGRGEGPAVAHNYMLRGFDAEHGQDIEFRVAGLPINLPSHIHGQGYADLGFLIGDTVQELRINEGVSDPKQGDFAVAGSVDLRLGVEQRRRGVQLRSSYGSFNTFRQLALWAPPEASFETFGAAQYTSTEGFGENRAGQSGSAIFQHRFGEGELSYRAIGILHTARADIAGVVRRDDVESDRVCFTCVYPYATARAQGALSQRFLIGLFADYEDAEGASGQLGAWLGYDNFRLQENFTGFLHESQTLARVAGLGDLIEQRNSTLSLGLSGHYRSSPFRPTSWASVTLELGAEGRLDAIDQAQNLLDAAVRNQTWDRRIDASVKGVDLGVYGELDWSLTDFVRWRIGLRADLLSYEIDDRLGNFAPLSRPQDAFIPGFRRSALGLAIGPRTSLELRPLDWLSLLAAYGEGYRSPQARLLENGESAPFTKVHSGDVGIRITQGDLLRLSLGGYLTRLSDDVAFDASEGRLERIGRTERLGAVAHVTSRPLPWLVGSVSATFVHATLLEPPPASAEEPQPPFQAGQSLPFVPPLVVRADLGAERTFVPSLAGRPFAGRAGLGLSYLSSRPLPYGDFSDPLSLLDASAGLSWGPLELSLEIFNLLNAEYAAVEYSFPSDWDPDDGVRPRTPARSTSAGAPLSWMLSLGVTL